MTALERKIKLMKEKRDQYEVKVDQCKRDIEELTSKIAKEEKRLETEVSHLVADVEAKISQSQKQLSLLRAELKNLQEDRVKANQEREELVKKDKIISEKLEALKADLTLGKDKLKQLEQRIVGSIKVVDHLRQLHPWIDTEKEFFGVKGHRYDFEHIDKVRSET